MSPIRPPRRNRRRGPLGRVVGPAAAFAVVVLGCGAAAAHAFWIEPHAFWLPRPGDVDANLMVGSEAQRDRWGAKASLVSRIVRRGPGGEQDLRAVLRAPPAEADAKVRLAWPGLHLIAVETHETVQELPADRFNAYASEEGLSLALAERARRNTEDRPGREAFSRRAKALIQVGPRTQDASAVATARLGQTLEIVPERDPFTLPAGEPLPVRLYYEGRPLSGATVELISLDIAGGRVARRVTDADGRVSLKLPRVGSWLLNAIWSKPVERADADFETVFASLTFGYPSKR